ncbi:MAG TPA: class I SAM-dependent methyltransferase [Plantibacter sp.]|uniref:class I SAM-dependent methyltransferase n=1 Tax=unclassified Plantibacter TaxID=2624265 RepID=UPI002BF3F080|nr:class I SAM-dependent methyltransferase [Plantibacter sp.]
MAVLPDLTTRATDLSELMDDPDCDPALLAATYARFGGVNRLVSGWRGIYRSRIRPMLDPVQPTTILDIGFGGGDVPLAIARWAQSDGLSVRITAIDPDERSLAFVRRATSDGQVTFRRAHSSELVAGGERFDVVLSNHVLHHLDAQTLASLLADSTALAGSQVLHNDLERSALAYAAYGVATWPGRRSSFLHIDGLRSIRRSYRSDELQALTPPGWTVERRFPMRLLLSRAGAPPAGASDA